MKSGSAFSWADEVEKEEEEARIRACEQQRSNPFGSARPREVVLQEKGIDWRKLDQDLHQSSNIRYENPAAEKPLKENNPAYSARTANKKQEISVISSGRNLQSKPEIRDHGFNRREVSGGFVIPQKPMGGVFVAPPPRYQTRNVFACLPEEAYHTSDNKFQYGNHIDFLYKNSNEAEREMMFHEPQKRQFYHCDYQLGWEREYAEFIVSGRRYSGVELRRPWMEQLHCGRNLGKSVACEERRDADTDYNRRKFLKREALLTPERRLTSIDHDGRNAGIGRMPMNPPSSGAAQLGQCQRQQLHNNSGSRMVNSARREMYLEKKEKGQFAGGSMEEPSDGKRAEVQSSVKKGANSAGNCRKRTMKSGPERYHKWEKKMN